MSAAALLMAVVTLRTASVYRGNDPTAGVSTAIRGGECLSVRRTAIPCDRPPLQVLLTWSKEKYEYQFSIYADNIAGKSFERL